MGNIFKTLGLDDLARQFLPGIGGTVADTLNNLPLGQKSGPGANSGNMLNQVGLGGPTSTRISNEDYQHNQNLLDSSNPREIARTGAFLEGVAPSQGKAMEMQAPYQAAAHNTYEDATYGADTQRQVGRIQEMSSGLNMSPWEITGSGASSGQLSAPPARPADAGNPQTGAAFLQALTPLKIAEMNNKTSLMQTMMQTNTQKSIADQSTNQGGLPKAQQAREAAATILAGVQATKTAGADTKLTEQQTATSRAQEDYTYTQSAAAENQMYLSAIQTLLQLLPSTNINMGAYNTTEKKGWEQLFQLYAQAPNGRMTTEMLSETIKKMPPKQWKETEEELIKFANLITKGASGGLNIMKGAGDFLSGITKGLK